MLCLLDGASPGRYARPAMRICSLLPSATEIVFALGLGDRLVAVTHECDFPEAARGLPVVTRSIMPHRDGASREIHTHIARALHAGSSIYALDEATLERLDPDLILTQELCEVCAVSSREVRKAAGRLAGRPTILSLEPTSLGGVVETVEQVGGAAGVDERARAVVDRKSVVEGGRGGGGGRGVRGRGIGI